MLVWVFAVVITMGVLKLGKIKTKPAKLAIGSLVVTTVAGLLTIPVLVLLGNPEIVTDLSSVLSFVIASLLSAWFLIAKSKLSMIAICIYFVFQIVGTATMLPSLPFELWFGTAAAGVIAVVGLVSGIYCLWTWNTSVLNEVDVLTSVFE
jgi:hypothetical protein